MLMACAISARPRRPGKPIREWQRRLRPTNPQIRHHLAKINLGVDFCPTLEGFIDHPREIVARFTGEASGPDAPCSTGSSALCRDSPVTRDCVRATARRFRDFRQCRAFAPLPNSAREPGAGLPLAFAYSAPVGHLLPAGFPSPCPAGPDRRGVSYSLI
jgi:hypothetical protein